MMIEIALERALEKIATLEARVAALEAYKSGIAGEQFPHLTEESLWSTSAEKSIRDSLVTLGWRPLNGSERVASKWEYSGMIGEIKTTNGGVRYKSEFVQVC